MRVLVRSRAKFDSTKGALLAGPHVSKQLGGGARLAQPGHTGVRACMDFSRHTRWRSMPF